MSDLLPPPKTIKQAKQQATPLPTVSPKVKLLLVLMGFLLYVYLIIFVKTMYMKVKRLDRIAVMAMETENLIHQVHIVDQNMAINMERLEDAYGDY
ncbi:unnamed protein product [Parnassius apollo]|uniref:(apollo) hypothetical protein n=1 Tax=Parnassius apollo TaxID=110799 RepID=A0A8S3XMN2_PARAO|nr:unnamed protein product [Parnassius apollo]